MQNENISLYFTDSRSDKEYHAQLVKAGEENGGDLYQVNFQNGRRGGPLQSGTKTASPLPYDKAKKIYDKLVAEKIGKGYTPGKSGIAYQGTAKEASFTGVLPQLLNPIDETDVERLINDPAYVMQEKFNGERVPFKRIDAVVTGINKKGMERPLPEPLVADAGMIEGDCTIDGELLGGGHVAFDILDHGGEDLRCRPYQFRLAILRSVIAKGSTFIRVCETYFTAEEKRKAFDALRAANREGVVFKRLDAPYEAGRPNSGGPQLKFKFYETATVRVAGTNGGKRSVRLHLFDAAGQAVEVGNVTIPPSASIPQEGEFIEVRYLYATSGHQLYQPTYIGKRCDQDATDCLLSQLKYQPEDSLALAA